MKRLLVISYYFPPSGGPGVQRVLKHIQYLPEFGWEPIVLTVKDGDYPARDESLLKKIPENTQVIRVPFFEPYRLYRKLTGKPEGTPVDVNVIKKEDQKVSFKEKVAEFIRATFFIPDARIAWFFSAKKELKSLFKALKIDGVYSSSPPYTCSLIGHYVQKEFGIPWVAGFRDPWTNFISSPKRWFLPANIDRNMEHTVFSKADAVECAWKGIIKDAFNKFSDLNINKFHHIPNGFDSADFPKVELQRNEKFTITYTGSMYGRRNPKSFIEAIELLLQKSLIKKEKIKLRFVGRFGNEVEEMFQNTDFSNSIEKISYCPHSVSIKHLLTSDALLLIVDESKESEEIVPGKVYEYLGVGKPIIAIAPQKSAISKLINETKAGEVAHQTEIDKIADIILKFYVAWESMTQIVFPNQDLINSFERRNAAKQLADILEELLLIQEAKLQQKYILSQI